MINLRETCVFPLETQGLYSTARVHNFFRPGRNGNSVGSEVTHRPMAAEINRCRLSTDYVDICRDRDLLAGVIVWLELTFFRLCLVWCRVIHDRDISKVYSIEINDIHDSDICFNDACLHTLSTVISTWCNLCEIYIYIYINFCTKPIVVMGLVLPLLLSSRVVIMTTCNAASCSSHFSVFMHLFKCFYASNQIVCEISLDCASSLSPYLAICFLQTTRKYTPWLTYKSEVWEVFKWLIV